MSNCTNNFIKRVIGVTRTFKWTVTTNGAAVPLVAEDLTLQLVPPRGEAVSLPFDVDDNIVSFTWQGDDQHIIGCYSLILWANYGEDNQRRVDIHNFVELIPWSDRQSGEYSDLVEESIELETADFGENIMVVDNLNSTSATDALSANMGRQLNVTKQDVIQDLATIRSGAAAGAAVKEWAKNDPLITDDATQVSASKLAFNGNIFEQWVPGIASSIGLKGIAGFLKVADISQWDSAYNDRMLPTVAAVKAKLQAVLTALATIEAVIPSQASSTNKLTDKGYVDGAIATNTANFVGTFDSLAELQAVQNPTKNDYGFVIETDAQGNEYYDRYKYTGTQWLYEYKVESTPFTAEQWAAIQSGITAALVSKLSALPTNAELNTALASKQPVINDLTTIRSGAAAGATAYQKPSGGIPASDMASAVQTSLGKADSAYQKPSGGIPASDMASAVQTSLGKADAAAPQSTTYTKTEVDALLQNVDIDVDSALSTTSENPVQNKVVTSALNTKQDSSQLATINGSRIDQGGNVTIVAAEGQTITIDAAPTQGSNNAVSSGGVYNAINDNIFIDVEMTTGLYIGTAQGVGNVCPLTTTTLTGMDSAVLNVPAGQVVKIKGVGGRTPRLWAILDKDTHVILEVADANATTPANPFEKTITAEYDCIVVVNVYNSRANPTYGNSAHTPYKVVTNLLTEVDSRSKNNTESIEKIDSFLFDDVLVSGKIAAPMVEKIIDSTRTSNLYNSLLMVDGQYINNSGAIMSASGWATTNLIPVIGGGTYTISCKTSARNTGINWYDSNQERITSVSASSSIYVTHTAPENAAYLQFNVAANGSYSTEVMVVAGGSSLEYTPYVQISPTHVKGLDGYIKNVSSDGNLSVTKSGNTLIVNSNGNNINCQIERNINDIFGGNPVFNINSTYFSGLTFSSNDEIAPLHALNTTIGANHAQPCYKATITGHGLDNTSIGTAWVGNNKTYYIMRIVSENQIVFLSENYGTEFSPSFSALTTGTLTNGSTTLNVSSVSPTSLFPALKNHVVRLKLNGKDEIVEDGEYLCSSLDVVESYEIMNPASTLTKIIARAGQTDDPIYDGDTAIIVENTYRFIDNLTLLVMETIMPVQPVAFVNAMFSQSAIIGASATTKYYIPNSLPLASGYDFRSPMAVSWSSSVPSLAVYEEQMANPSNPVNRVIQYQADNVGFALGFITDRGIGQSLLDYTNCVFELRNNTGKIYPRGVNSNAVGSPLQVGQIYTGIMYRAFFNYPTTGERLSEYHFKLGASMYVFLDYAASVIDHVQINDSLNGEKIEVLESSNTTLMSDVYNGGLYVKATYINGETCYIVLKINS